MQEFYEIVLITELFLIIFTDLSLVLLYCELNLLAYQYPFLLFVVFYSDYPF